MPSGVNEFIKKIRKQSADDIVIYTGYTEEEIKTVLQCMDKALEVTKHELGL